MWILGKSDNLIKCWLIRSKSHHLVMDTPRYSKIFGDLGFHNCSWFLYRCKHFNWHLWRCTTLLQSGRPRSISRKGSSSVEAYFGNRLCGMILMQIMSAYWFMSIFRNDVFLCTQYHILFSRTWTQMRVLAGEDFTNSSSVRTQFLGAQIGRASCRERVSSPV